MLLLTKENHACIPTGTANIMNQSRQSICRNTAFRLVITIHICSKVTSPIDTVCICTTIFIKDNFTYLVFVSNHGKQISRVHSVCFTNSRRIDNAVAPNSTHDFSSHKSCPTHCRITIFFKRLICPQES